MAEKHPELQLEGEVRPLSKAEACKVLQVAPAADEELITKAYWHLARKFRVAATSDPDARARLDELNRAYVVLNPGKTEAPLANELQPAFTAAPGFFDELGRWVRRAIEHTKARWPEHLAEVAVLTGTTTVLTVLALESGASPVWTLLVAGIAGLTIWAPWRRPAPPHRPEP